MHDAFEVSGIFILLSSLAFDTDEILEVYYLRQQVEQYFDVSKLEFPGMISNYIDVFHDKNGSNP
jgi:hypothetical protein